MRDAERWLGSPKRPVGTGDDVLEIKLVQGRIAATLRTHGWNGEARNNPAQIRCACGEWVPNMYDHQAEQIAAAMQDSRL